MNNRPRPKFFSLLFDLLLDSALIGMGVAIYYHFEVMPLGSFTLSPVVVDMFGNKETAVLVISLVPIGIVLISLVRTIYRALTGLVLTSKL